MCENENRFSGFYRVAPTKWQLFGTVRASQIFTGKTQKFKTEQSR
jgi:hypothetical protein